ncbi:MAG: efflux RND transporter periplasmic adaptor subunit [Bryobacterales bacterium]|nr:efflux RND transporter periplasmic adaptor subunit [Bryobacterales bacterium]
MTTRGKTYASLLAVVALTTGGFAAKGWLSNGNTDGSEQAGGEESALGDAVPVSTEVAIRGPISHLLGSTANLRARREVAVAAQAAGIVTSVKAEEGDFVKAGQVLCALDDRDLQIDLELVRQRLAQTKIQIEAAVIRAEQTRTRLRNKRTELERNEEALREGLLAESEVAVQRHEIDDLEHEIQAVESTVRENRHRQDELESEIRKVELQISQTAITAPFAGRITERTVELGQSIRSAEKLYTLGAFTPLYADVYLPENDSRSVRAGQKAALRLGSASGDLAEGAVERVSPVVDEETGTVKVTVRFNPPNPAFRPGAFVRVEIETHTLEDAILIPKQSVIEEDGQTYVVLVGDDRTAQRTAVQLGYQDETAIQVTSGLEAGAIVVTAGQGKLKDGDKTRVVAN